MIEEVKEFFGDVKETVGDKWFYILIAGAGALFIYFLLKDDGESAETEVYYTPSGTTGYPEVGANSEVVMDSVNKTIESFSSEIMNALQSTQNSMTEMQGTIDQMQTEIDERFDATNDYIADGLSKWEDISDKVDNINTTPTVVYVPTQTETTPTQTETKTSGVSDTVRDAIKKAVAKKKAGKDTTTVLPTNTGTKPATATNTNMAVSDTYTYKTQSGLNTSTSIVDALKATGVDSSFENRAKIAAANGITNYTGTAKQNTEMLNKLKAGELVKTSSPKSQVVTSANSGLAGISSLLNGG